ncbi:MAG: M28 family peptidase [Verrucomicrobia bacterium]|nr:M28 family peptidase [Verrucomicrobiota bacterium]
MFTVSQPKLFKFLLIGLPVGLAMSVVIALVLYYTEPGRNAPSKDDALRFAAPVSEADLNSVVLTLSGTVGPRSLTAEPEAAARARKFVQSSLGAENMGYEVDLFNRKIGATECPSVIATLSGKGRSREVIVVAAPYTSVVGSPGASRSASGIAAVVSIAKALTGSEHQRTIQFVAYASEATDPASNDLTGALRASEDFTVVAVLNLDSLAFPIRDGGVWEVEVPMIVHSNDDALGTSVVNKFARITGLRLTLAPGASKVGADHRSFLPTLTFVADVADSPAGSAADAADVYEFSRLTQTVQKLQRLVERLANPDGV